MAEALPPKYEDIFPCENSTENSQNIALKEMESAKNPRSEKYKPPPADEEGEISSEEGDVEENVQTSRESTVSNAETPGNYFFIP